MNNNASNASNTSSPISQLIPILIFAIGCIGIYYLYQYYYGFQTLSTYTLIGPTQSANPSKPIIITSDKMPILYEGGEFSISTWIYITDWRVRHGKPKSILSIGGEGEKSFNTIRMYLGGYKPKLHIRFHTREANQSNDTLSVSAENQELNNMEIESGLLDVPPICDLPEVDLQRWVNVTVAVNGKSVDVYMDGKLSRSCVLPAVFKVNAGGYSAFLLKKGGFGGQIARTTMYDRALNPEQVYKNYMSGPEAIENVIDWVGGWFKAK
jgi:hypothetical protein